MRGAIELVDWGHKKKIGPLAYLIAGLKALREQKLKIIVAQKAGRLLATGFDRQRTFVRRTIGSFPAGRFA